jgi:biopolymer transport protein ExbD
MSHGAGGEDIPEPNLTPLLDLVLQMVMFFMIVANFVTEQLNQNIQLPEATTAVPIDREKENILVLNVDSEGVLLERSTDPNDDTKLDSQIKIQRWMNDKFAFYKSDRGDKAAKEMTIVVRGDKNTTFENIYRVMRAAKEAGFINVQLRANRPKDK